MTSPTPRPLPSSPESSGAAGGALTPGPLLDPPDTGAGQVQRLAQQVIDTADADTALIEAALAGTAPKKRRPKPAPYQPRHAAPIHTAAS